MTHPTPTHNDNRVDLSFIPCHIVERVKDEKACRLFDRILQKARCKNVSTKGLQKTVVIDLKGEIFDDGKDVQMASSREFQDIVSRRSFDKFGQPIRVQKVPKEGDV